MVFVLSLVSILMLTSFAAADSFIQTGCRDSVSEITYQPMDFWTFQEDKCYNCLCLEHKQPVAFCIEEKTANKKSIISSPIFSSILPDRKVGHATAKLLPDEEIAVTQEEAANFRCKPKPKPYIDPVTGKQTFPEVKLVTYVYKELVSQCVRRTTVPVNVPPTCKVVKLDDCNYSVVNRANPKFKCTEKFDLV